ncbi:hypothetical protein F5Y14DRAFT_416147 [Nemania sp. NC0429]|nr:hypothetical protein F5Y14DRAFT_416147 [Nemania sp. NC0429]
MEFTFGSNLLYLSSPLLHLSDTHCCLASCVALGLVCSVRIHEPACSLDTLVGLYVSAGITSILLVVTVIEKKTYTS